MTEFHIVEYDEIAKQIDEVKEYSNFIPDVSTDEGYQKSKRVSLDIGKVLTNLESKRKEKKAHFLEGGRQVDTQAKKIAETLQEMQLPHKEAYKELDKLKKEREERRKQELEDRISSMRCLPDSMRDSCSDEIQAALNQLHQEQCTDFYEYTKTALEVRNESIKQLGDLFAKTLKAEKEAEELAKLRKEQAEREQKERDERIAREAKEKADKEAAEREAKIEREKQEIIEREKQQKIQAEKDAKAAEDARIATENYYKEQERLAEQKRLDDIEAAKQAEIKRQQDEQARLDAEAAKREANKRHNAKINNAIVKVLVANGISEEDAKTVVILLAKRELPNASISY